MIALLLGFVSSAAAARPDSGSGMFAFDAADELAWVEGPEGRVRVTYSLSGPNQTLLADDDGSGSPDYAEDVAASAEAVLDFYAELGFLRPLSEADMGLGELGGSGAFDFYLLDFGGSADGQFVTDTCSGGRCSGFMNMENDFAGYGYSSLAVAIRVLTSHELFHAVQAAYNGTQAAWLSEGTAVWAEYQYDPGTEDFISLCGSYLAETTRSLDSPPAGSVTGWSYGTALFFQFLTERYAPGVIVALEEAMEGRAAEGEIAAITDVLADWGTDWATEWPVFARWNLAVGSRAGVAESYPFAASLRKIVEEAEGSEIVDDNRFYPLAATYFRLDHAGGPLFLGTAEEAAGLVFTVHPVVDGGDDGPVADAIATWAPAGPETLELGEQPAGGYWLVGSYPAVADQSVKVLFCFGGEAALEACAAGPVDSGDPADSGEPDDTAGGEAPGTGGEADEGKGCGCASAKRAGSAASGLTLLLSLGLALGARRRPSPPAC